VRFDATVRDVVVSGAVAGVVSGAPSTAYALWTGGDPLEASLAAGTILLPRERRDGRLLAAGAVAHAALSLGWAAVLAAILPRRAPVVAAAAGVGIAALDLGVVGRRLPRVRALPVAAQLADHVVFAATVGAVLSRRRARGAAPTAPASR
jgi:hypothetical protein